MKLLCHSFTYHNSTLEMREKFAFNANEQDLLYKHLKSDKSITEAVILCTCNRTEIYLYAKKDASTDLILNNFMASINEENSKIWKQNQKIYQDIEAVRHIFTIAAGLDSQMIGEHQIVNQLKCAYSASVKKHMSKFFLHKLMHTTFRVARLVRSHTNLGIGAMSISNAAVELASRIVDFQDSIVLIIGAGKNALIAAKFLAHKGVKDLYIANRTLCKAQAIVSEIGAGKAICFEKVCEKLSFVDVVLCSTSSDKPLITIENSSDILSARDKPVILLDVAMPRDIAPTVGALKNVLLYNLDDLDEQIKYNKSQRQSEVPKATCIVDHYVDNFSKWINSLDSHEIIAKLSLKMNEIAITEAKRYANLFCQDDQQQLTSFAESLMKKIMHGPINYLKVSEKITLNDESYYAANLINKIFFDSFDNNLTEDFDS